MKHNPSLVFVGAGMANTAVLVRVIAALAHGIRLKHLTGESTADAIKITLINADRHFGSGVAYGKADACFLLNTPIALIEPKREFRAWLEDHLDWIAAYIQTHSGNAGEVWLEKHWQSLQRGDYAEICLPRLVYGLFLKAQLWQACDQVKQVNQRYGANIQLEFLQATVESIRRFGQSFQISLQGRAESVHLIERETGEFDFITQAEQQICQLQADLVSFGIGFVNVTHPDLVGQPGYFPSVYQPGMDQITQAILDRPTSSVTLALLGTKAAALDVIYCIEHQPRLREKVKILAISSSGQTRYPAILSDRPPYLPTLLLEQLSTLQTSEALVAAVQQELARGEAAGYTRLDVWRVLGGYVKLARQRLPLHQKQKFDRDGQAQLRKVTSFTDSESIEAFNHLKADEILQVVSGQIQSVESCPDRPHRFCIQVTQASGVAVLNADLVINCMGPAPLNRSHHSLVASVIDRQLAAVNESGMGMRVSGDREASPNFFVVGPLTSGGEIANPTKRGEPEFHPARHTMPYVLEDADAAGKTIATRLLQFVQQNSTQQNPV